jgi:hypothetical protein
VGNLKIDVLEIVDAGSANDDCFRGHEQGPPHPCRDRTEWFRSGAESFYYKFRSNSAQLGLGMLSPGRQRR